MLSLFSSRASRSASSSATGSASGQTCHSHTREAEQTATTSFGPTLSNTWSKTSHLLASQLPEVKQLVVMTATQKLFGKNYFDICTLQDIAKLIDAPTKGGEAWPMLQALHCVHYADMPPMLRDAIPHLVSECLSAREQAATDALTALKGVSL